jgi:hypothetical protein
MLTREICKHIFSNLGAFHDLKNSLSLFSEPFLLQEKINFDYEDMPFKRNIYGCRFSMLDRDLELVATECGILEKEYYAIIKIEKNIYGISFKIKGDSEVSMFSNSWKPVGYAMQAALLLNFEQIKDYNIKYYQLQSSKDMYDNLISYIEYRE